MIGALIIVFREVIEAGLIIGIVLAATRNTPGSRMWVSGGVLAGIAGSAIVAFSMTSIAGAFGGYGQEVFNAAILGTAVIMLVWHNVWMAGHGRVMANDLFAAGRDVLEGKRPLAALAIVVGAAVLREGAEVVLFLYGVAVSDGSTVGQMFAGGLAGVVLGGALSALTYFGLVRIPPRHLFLVTGILIAFLAAGMAAQAAAQLQQAGIVESLTATAWNTKHILSERSLTGQILHTLIGYSERPTVLQVVAYVGTLIAMYGLTRWARSHPATAHTTQGAPAE
ncbi:MAG: FTR1 family protein [Alphaproteobacteria bacterium]|nr:FTR1 family protein [Alphaproteobacteria bacterium]